MKATEQAAEVAEIRSKTADRVREDSARMSLTPLGSVCSQLPDLTPEQVNDGLAGISSDDRYSDIQFAAAADGAVYLYSTVSLLPEHAAVLIGFEESKVTLAERIRADSRERGQLTSVSGLPTGQGMSIVAFYGLAKDDRYDDIALMIDSSGAAYLYSEMYLSDAYATVLARVGAGDAAAMIVQTVREQSRAYPTPTNVEVFNDPVFKIDAAKLDASVADTLARPQFADIHRIVHAGTGACYLYSDRYLSEAHARSLVEWLEVGRFQNP